MNAIPEVIVVAGAPRCGTTLMMQMLEAGGFPVYHGGNRVGYECRESQEALVVGGAGFLDTLQGKAVKLLDPQRIDVPLIRIAWVWMNRDAVQQALSQIKFMGQMFSGMRPNVERLAASIRRDNQQAPVALSRRDRSRVLVVDFERLLTVPRAVVAEVVGFVNAPMDQEAMVQCVLPRDGRCALGLDIELSRMRMIEREEAALAAGVRVC